MRRPMTGLLVAVGLVAGACERQGGAQQQQRQQPAEPVAAAAAAAATVPGSRPVAADAGTPDANTVHPPDNAVHEKPSEASPRP